MLTELVGRPLTRTSLDLYGLLSHSKERRPRPATGCPAAVEQAEHDANVTLATHERASPEGTM